jgi:hypothetical protein
LRVLVVDLDNSELWFKHMGCQIVLMVLISEQWVGVAAGSADTV